MDPRNKEIDLDSFMDGKFTHLTEEDMKNQEGQYIYRYRYNGGGSSQVWLGSGRYSRHRINSQQKISSKLMYVGFMLSSAEM